MSNRLKEDFFNPVFIAALLTAVFVYTNTRFTLDRSPYTSAIEKTQVNYIEGEICSNPVKTSGSEFYAMQVKVFCAAKKTDSLEEKGASKGKVTVFVPAKDVEALYPERLYSVSETEGFLYENGAQVSLDVKWSEKSGAFFVQKTDSLFYPQTFIGKIKQERAYARLMFKRLMCAWGSAGALILSLLSGSREYTSSEVSSAFRNAGLSHILALSGMHLSFFSSLAQTLSSKILGKKYSFIPSLFAILCFVFFAGFSPSLFRALLFSLVMLFSKKVFCPRLSEVRVLSGVFIVHTVVRPSDCKNIAFILSYLSLFGILIFAEPLKRFFVRILPPKISESISSSFGAQIATAPVSLTVFGAVYPVGIISCLIVSPLISIFLTAALVAIIFSLCMPFLSEPFGYIMNVLYSCIMFFVNLFAKVKAISF